MSSKALFGVLTLLVASAAQATTVCPGAQTVKGIDVSVYQGTINWPQVKASGITWAYARFSDGYYLDTQFHNNWTGMKAAGVIRGAYQFFEPGEDPTAQANAFVNAMGPLGAGDLPPMLDMEVTGGQSGATIAAHIQTWINVVQSRTGRRPVIYTGTWFWDPHVGSSAFSSYGLVESWYCTPGSCCPNLPSPWKSMWAWQYADNGRVGGISGNVDMDLFNGSLAELQKAAGGNPDWAAQYVNQTFPLASTPLKLTVGQEYKGYIELKNIGAKTWDTKTRLGTTQPRDRKSVFVGPDWLNASRPSGIASGTVAPGLSHRFYFTLKAPQTPGSYKEFFGVVEEGIHWFSDPGQGGPADNQLEIWIEVAQAAYHGQVVATSWGTAPSVALPVGATKQEWVDIKNIGTATWHKGTTKLAPTPRDMATQIGGSDWLSATRVSTLTGDVAPGATGRFLLPVHGNAVGNYTQTFSLVEESVTWFADEPKGAGPPDNGIKLVVQVGAAPPLDFSMAPVDMADPGGTDDGGTDDGGPGTADGGTDDGGAGVDLATPRNNGGADMSSPHGNSAHGCAAAPGSPVGGVGLAGLLLLVAFAFALKRRRA